MTGLSSYTPVVDTVQFPGGEFTVRALAFDDIAALVQDHYTPLAALFDRYVGEAGMVAMERSLGDALPLSDMKGVALEALNTTPKLIGDAIARAAGEPENMHITRLLPMAVQIEALGKIVRMTLEAEGGMEKLMVTLNLLTASLSTALKKRSP